MDGDGGGCRPHINRFTCAQVHITEKKIAIPRKEQRNKTKQKNQTREIANRNSRGGKNER